MYMKMYLVFLIVRLQEPYYQMITPHFYIHIQILSQKYYIIIMFKRISGKTAKKYSF